MFKPYLGPTGAMYPQRAVYTEYFTTGRSSGLACRASRFKSLMHSFVLRSHG